MKHQWQWLTTLLCLAILENVTCEPPRTHYRAPLVYKSWPPITRSSQPFRSGMLLQLRGSPSSNIVSRVPVPNMMIKSHNPINLAMPMRYANFFGGPKTAPSSHIYYRTGAPKKTHYTQAIAAHSQPVIKFSSPGHKTAIKFKSPPPLKSKPEFIYEKVFPKFAEPIIANEAAIHQIAAPNLSLNQLDNDLTKTSIQAFGSALEKPVHQYQVQEQNYNDLTVRNQLTGSKSFFAPDNDPSLKTTPLKPVVNDPINSPSDGKPKPSDVLYHSTIDFNASPLVQQHFAVDPFQFPVTSQPQLQQYHHQQSAMLTQGLPFAAYNPTYLVQMSNNLLGQYQQHIPHLFSPAHGFIDTSNLQHQVPAPPVSKNYEIASIGQILTAQKDFDHQFHDSVTSTLSPSTIADFYHHDVSAASQNVPSVVHLPEPKPNSYLYSQNFIDLPDFAPNNDIQNSLNYDEAYRRQIENDLILKEAHEHLKGKLELQKKQEAAAFDVHKHALAEQFSPLRIIVPDEEEVQLKKRADDDETYFDDDEEEEGDDIEHAADEEMSEEEKSSEKSDKN